MHDPDIDAALDGALSRLTTVRAPETLLPRVLAAAQRLAARPWYARTWDTWPLTYQKASIAICLLALAAMTQTLPFVDGGVWLGDVSVPTGGRFDAWQNVLREAARVARGANAVSSTAASLWQAFSTPLLLYASAIAVLLCLVIGLSAVALDRLTPGRALSR